MTFNDGAPGVVPASYPVDGPRSGGRIGGALLPGQRQPAESRPPSPLVDAVDQRSLLRLHCATVSVPGVTDLYPAHPVYGGRTRPVEFAALTGVGGALRQLLLDGPGQGADLVDYLAEYLLRPSVVVFRELLEHGVANGCCPSPRFLGHELAHEGRFTGRLVIGVPGDPAPGAPVPSRVGSWARRIAAHCDGLIEQFGRCGLAGDGAVDAARAALRRIVAEELRHLGPATARVLRGAHPWREFVHTVAIDQDSVLRQLLAAVAAVAARRRGDCSLPSPVVVADPAELARVPGFRRLAWDVYDVGGEVVPTGGQVRRRAVIATLTSRRDGGCDVSGVGALASLETAAWPRASAAGVPALSHARSLGELQLGELRSHRLAREHVLRLNTEQSLEIVDGLLRHADAAARRTGQAALATLDAGRLAEAKDAPGDTVVVTAALIHRVLTRKQFIKGSRSNYPVAQAVVDMGDAIAAGEPVRFVLRGFPFKQCESGLKALGPLPDLAELGALVRLRELLCSVRQVYPPGGRITVLTDGRHFRNRPATALRAYRSKLVEYLAIVGVADLVELVDLDERAEVVLGTGVSLRRAERIDRHQRALRAVFAHLDVTSDPLRVLREADATEYQANGSGGQPGTGPVFRDLFKSIAFSVRVPLPGGADRMEWSRAVYADLYELTGDVPHPVAMARRQVLRQAWLDTVRYVSALRADRDLGYDQLFAGGARLRPGAPQPGGCGFTFLGGSCLLPWHGTGVVSAQGTVSTDFAVALFDQGFVPVVSPLLGTDQPWLMVPVNRTNGGELDGRFVASIRLRKR